MKRAFTLIELLVVMLIMTVIMSLVVPKGSKMLDGFTKVMQKIKEEHNLSLERSYSFIKVKEQDVKVLDSFYSISSKGVLNKNEKSDDNR